MTPPGTEAGSGEEGPVERREEGDWTAAVDRYRRALAEPGSADSIARTRLLLAEALDFLGDEDEAGQAGRASVEEAARIGDEAIAARGRALLGRIARSGRRWRRAHEEFDASARVLAERGAPADAALVLLEDALLALDQMDLAGAVDRHGRAVALADGAAAPPLLAARLALVEGGIGLLAPGRGEPGSAFEVALRAADAAGPSPLALETGWAALHGQAIWHSARGEMDAAEEVLVRAQDRIAGILSTLSETRVRSFLDRDPVHRVLLELQVVRASIARAGRPESGGRATEPQLADVVAERNALLRFEAVARAFAAETDLDRLLSLVMDISIESSGAERGFLILVEEGKARFRIARNLDREEVQSPDFKVSSSIVRRVTRTGRAILADDAVSDPELRGIASVRKIEIRSILCVPMAHARGITGAIYLDHRFLSGVFGPKDVAFLESVARQAALSIECARLVAEVDRRRQEIGLLNGQLEKRIGQQSRELEALRRRVEETDRADAVRFEGLIGTSDSMRRVFDTIPRLAESALPVLVEGESGTGKELVARAIHRRSPRRAASFVAENCGSIPQGLVESVLFGHRKGSFTGATEDRPGLFELADGGTLFLDEIGEMPLEVQKTLLRALQEGEVRPVGAPGPIRVDVRIVAATHRDLAAMVEAGTFRQDLYYRLHVLSLALPPLRERPEDVAVLVEAFLADGAAKTGRPRRLDPAALAALQAHRWPGNVRELENEVRRWSTLAGDVVTPDDLTLRASGPPALPPPGEGLLSIEGKTLKEIEAHAIGLALARSGGNKKLAAERLGISRRGLYDKLQSHGIDP